MFRHAYIPGALFQRDRSVMRRLFDRRPSSDVASGSRDAAIQAFERQIRHQPIRGRGFADDRERPHRQRTCTSLAKMPIRHFHA